MLLLPKSFWVRNEPPKSPIGPHLVPVANCQKKISTTKNWVASKNTVISRVSGLFQTQKSQIYSFFLGMKVSINGSKITLEDVSFMRLKIWTLCWSVEITPNSASVLLDFPQLLMDTRAPSVAAADISFGKHLFGLAQFYYCCVNVQFQKEKNEASVAFPSLKGEIFGGHFAAFNIVQHVVIAEVRAIKTSGRLMNQLYMRIAHVFLLFYKMRRKSEVFMITLVVLWQQTHLHYVHKTFFLLSWVVFPLLCKLYGDENHVEEFKEQDQGQSPVSQVDEEEGLEERVPPKWTECQNAWVTWS